ncbi:MAG: prepilin-type N-terminal cleavage/methylation domain-containing protein [Planctomycetota bacterium]|nr:prepilin-type N-terminal cleavage/methylation domain-containing protein [Planctomycetota bacterium]MDA1105042.1 prepilin-type N-terminal cleavage/methylation domain-containing protein [Planctomycetota bacterium]
MSRTARTAIASTRRGFSLIELLLAVFILAIGIIGVSAIFPAGIVQQRAAQDDTFGPLVAESALSVLRGKVRVRDFGSFEQFQDGSGIASPDFLPGLVGSTPIIHPQTLATNFPSMVPANYRPLVGDWRWKRPAIIFQDTIAGLSPGTGYQSAIDIFGATVFETINAGTGSYIARVAPANVRCETTLSGYPMTAGNLGRCYGIPWNIDSQGSPPWAIVTMRERTWPQGADYDPSNGNGNGSLAKQQYVWDCMFRRKGGRIQVAVFVYRTASPGGESSPYIVPTNQITASPTDPLGGPLPVFPRSYILPISPTNERWGTGGLDNNLQTAADATVVPGTNANTGPGNWTLSDDAFAWQAPGQWILDTYGSVHRFARGRRNKSEGPCRLTSPIQFQAPCAANFPYGWTPFNSGTFDAGQVSNSWIDQIWFMPTIDSAGNTITPVFIAVQEL